MGDLAKTAKSILPRQLLAVMPFPSPEDVQRVVARLQLQRMPCTVFDCNSTPDTNPSLADRSFIFMVIPISQVTRSSFNVNVPCP
jgi:hypothetical protein